MFEIGAIIGNARKPLLPLEDVKRITAGLNAKKLFDIAWKNFLPGEKELYTYVNLCSGEVHGGEALCLVEDCHIILFAFEVAPHNILTEFELHEFASKQQEYSSVNSGVFLYKWCKEHEIPFRERLEAKCIEFWNNCNWYWEAVIEENLNDFYAQLESQQLTILTVATNKS